VRFTYVIIDQGPIYPNIPSPNRVLFQLPVNQTEFWPGTSVGQSLPTPIDYSYNFRSGLYYSALSKDDLGGVSYLLYPTNINIEPTLPFVRALGGGTNFVNVAPRPGVDKITFERFDPGQPPKINIFTDSYFRDGLMKTQSLQRVIQSPDILFTAGNHPHQTWFPALVRRTRPNFSHSNATGSGILQPEIVISFEKLGDIYHEPEFQDPDDGWIIETRWSSFDSRTFTPSPIFPVGPAYQGGRTLSTRQIQDQNGPALEWKLRLIAGVQYAVESSPDLMNWTVTTNIIAAPIHTLTNAALSDSSVTFWRARRISGQ
jgi:hypothetical protein